MALNIFGYLHAPSMLQKKYSDVTYQTTREVYDISPYFENQNIYKVKASIEKNDEKIYTKIR